MRIYLGILIAAALTACGGDSHAKPGHAAAPTPVAPSQPVTGASQPPATTTTNTGPAPVYPLDDILRINQLQFKATHNSYHLAPTNPTADEAYSMPPLTAQLNDDGVRGFELDLHYYDGRFWVYHLPVDDPESTCPALADCLGELRGWSDAHPGHLPLVVFFDLRDTWDADKIIDHLDELDAALLAAFPRERVITPDDIARGEADVAAGVAKYGWPTLGAARGKIMFVLWSFGDVPYRYAYEGTTLAGRVMFVAATYTGWRHAVVLGMDTAQDQEAQIAAAVSAGYWVRTRADDQPGRGGDFPARFAAALRSGAQAILTDYPRGDEVPGYIMTIPGGTPARCNPLAAPEGCKASDVESPEGLTSLP